MEVAEGVIETAGQSICLREWRLDRRVCSGCMADGADADISGVSSRVGKSAGTGEPWFMRMRCGKAEAVAADTLEAGSCATVYKRDPVTELT